MYYLISIGKGNSGEEFPCHSSPGFPLSSFLSLGSSTGSDHYSYPWRYLIRAVWDIGPIFFLSTRLESVHPLWPDIIPQLTESSYTGKLFKKQPLVIQLFPSQSPRISGSSLASVMESHLMWRWLWVFIPALCPPTFFSEKLQTYRKVKRIIQWTCLYYSSWFTICSHFVTFALSLYIYIYTFFKKLFFYILAPHPCRTI